MQQQSKNLWRLWISYSIADVTILLSYHKRDVEGKLTQRWDKKIKRPAWRRLVATYIFLLFRKIF